MPGKDEEDWDEVPEGVDEQEHIDAIADKRLDDDLGDMLRDTGA